MKFMSNVKYVSAAHEFQLDVISSRYTQRLRNVGEAASKGGVALYLESLVVFSVAASQAQFYGREEVEFARVGLSGIGDFFQGVLRTQALSIHNDSVGFMAFKGIPLELVCEYVLVDKYFDVAFPRWGASFIRGFIGRTFEVPVMVIQSDIVISIHGSLFSTAVNGGGGTFDGDLVSSNGSDEFIPSKFKRRRWSSRGKFLVFMFPGERFWSILSASVGAIGIAIPCAGSFIGSKSVIVKVKKVALVTILTGSVFSEEVFAQFLRVCLRAFTLFARSTLVVSTDIESATILSGVFVVALVHPGAAIAFVTFYGASISSSAWLGWRQRVGSITIHVIELFSLFFSTHERGLFGKGSVFFVVLKVLNSVTRFEVTNQIEIQKGEVLKESFKLNMFIVRYQALIFLFFVVFDAEFLCFFKFCEAGKGYGAHTELPLLNFVFIHFSLEFLSLVEELSDSFSFRGDLLFIALWGGGFSLRVMFLSKITPFASGESIPDFLGEALFFYDSRIHTRVVELGIPTFPARNLERVFLYLFDRSGVPGVTVFFDSAAGIANSVNTRSQDAIFRDFVVGRLFILKALLIPNVSVSIVENGSSFVLGRSGKAAAWLSSAIEVLLDSFGLIKGVIGEYLMRIISQELENSLLPSFIIEPGIVLNVRNASLPPLILGTLKLSGNVIVLLSPSLHYHIGREDFKESRRSFSHSSIDDDRAGKIPGGIVNGKKGGASVFEVPTAGGQMCNRHFTDKVGTPIIGFGCVTLLELLALLSPGAAFVLGEVGGALGGAAISVLGFLSLEVSIRNLVTEAEAFGGAPVLGFRSFEVARFGVLLGAGGAFEVVATGDLLSLE
ncbi:unnamed protein product [Polarella glacialis]|uniref:Uncharacterized protein n=1 Tax=Polarella glacialis TaxID=89957 RepID=A0A813JPL8_POLGL|nr:unnamed protein product [Polarella glacialis]